jgi:sugar phosphate isomerase/epimerase
MTGSVASFMMPFSNVAHLAFDDKLKATALSGFTELSLMPLEVERILAGGLTFADMKSKASDHGVRVTRLDPLNTWPRIWRPDNMDEAYIRTVDTTPDVFFRLSEGLGCTHMSLNATFPRKAMPVAEITEHYAAICKRAREHGLICDLEFIPLWGVPTLDLAWEIVQDADAPNGGLVFDVWHFVRGGSRIETLRQIPGELIHCVQLNDGPLALPPGVSIKDDCYNRFFPGEGEFPNVELVRLLAETGGLQQLGPEVFSATLAGLSVEEVARKSSQSVASVLNKAGISTGN